MQLAVAIHRERCADHGRLQVVRHQRLHHTTERLERPAVQLQPRRCLLVEHHLGEQVSAVAEHHHEHPRVPQHVRIGAQQAARVAEIHLRDLAGAGLHRDRHIRGSHASLARQATTQPLHCPVAALERSFLLPQPVVNRTRCHPLLPQRLHLLPPGLDRGRLVSCLCGWRALCLHGGLERVQRRQGRRRPLQQPCRLQGQPVAPLRVGAHLQQPRDLARSRTEPVKSNELLEPMHLNSPIGHRGRIEPARPHRSAPAASPCPERSLWPPPARSLWPPRPRSLWPPPARSHSPPPHTSGTGDTYLRLFNPSGVQVASNDDSCGRLSFASHAATASGTYQIRAGCYSSNSCSGTVAYTIR